MFFFEVDRITKFSISVKRGLLKFIVEKIMSE